MNNLTLLLLVCFFSTNLNAQFKCSTRLDTRSVIANDHRQVSISNLSSLNFSFPDRGFVFDADGETELFELGYAKGIWAGGFDAGGSLKLAASRYGSRGCDFAPGPIWVNYQGVVELSEFFRRAWVVKNSDVKLMRSVFENGNLEISDIPLDILEWPGLGNPHLDFLIEEELAPFFDNNDDGVYDPLSGDYPIALVENPRLVPEQFRFYVINDDTDHHETFGSPLNMEFHVLDYVLSCSVQSESEKTVFTRLKYINKGLEDLLNFRIGIWSDSDLGCFEDDYVGCSPALNSSYVYNVNGVDKPDCNVDHLVVPSNYSVVRSNVFLTQNLESYNYYYNPGQGAPPPPQANPELPIQCYHYLDGRWKTGARMTVGGTGSNPGSTDFTTHVFTDFPNQDNGWSMQESRSFIGSDHKTISVFDKRNFMVGQERQVDFADHLLLSTEMDGLDVFEIYESRIVTLKEEFDAMREGSLDCNLIQKLVESSEEELRMSPNPANDFLDINFSSTIDEGTVRIVTGQGDLYDRFSLTNTNNYRLPIHNYQPGLYLIAVETSDGAVSASRFIKL